MDSFEQKALDVFEEIVINKSLVHKAGFGSRAIPIYVREWIISHYAGSEPDLGEATREKIARFVQKYVPAKSQRETIKNQLFEQAEVQILDNFSVYVNLTKGDRYLAIPFLDEDSAHATPKIIGENAMLLSSGLWGVGSLFYVPPAEGNPKGEIWMREFQPFQLANIDIGYFCDCRRSFGTEEWLNLIVSSMGFNHHLYTERQKILLICRLIPMVEPRYNLVELAPKGTGKSFVFENMSRYVAVRSGSITAPVLFFNDARKTPGLITRFDCVVLDEAQKVRSDSSGELTALLKSYLEAGRFGRGSAGSITAEAGLVMLANTDLDRKRQPLSEQVGLFRGFPNFLRETAFIDRFSGLLPGWYLPRISKNTPSASLGLKGDIFGEILHLLRNDISYRDYTKAHMELVNCDDMRDSRAIEAGATGLLKILFPDKNPPEEEFYRYCVNPALELRQRIRDELCKLDREYVPLTMLSRHPDGFQTAHQPASYVDENAPLPEPGLAVVEPTKPGMVEPEGAKAPEPSLAEKLEPRMIHIAEGETGHSYRELFGPYLRGAQSIRVEDPYVRLTYQIKNLLAFADIIDTSSGPVQLLLVTTAEDALQEQEIRKKLEATATYLVDRGIAFTFEFSTSLHDRSIEGDNGWRIIPGRGLDFFHRPEYGDILSEVDQKQKKCRQTNITYVQV